MWHTSIVSQTRSEFNECTNINCGMLLCLFVSWQLLMHIQNRKDCVQLPSIFHLLYRSLFVVHCFVFLSQFVGWAWVVRVHVSLIQAVALGKQWWQQQHKRQFRSFYCSFKHTFVPCHDIQSDVILTSLIFHGVKRVHCAYSVVLHRMTRFLFLFAEWSLFFQTTKYKLL